MDHLSLLALPMATSLSTVLAFAQPGRDTEARSEINTEARRDINKIELDLQLGRHIFRYTGYTVCRYN